MDTRFALHTSAVSCGQVLTRRKLSSNGPGDLFILCDMLAHHVAETSRANGLSSRTIHRHAQDGPRSPPHSLARAAPVAGARRRFPSVPAAAHIPTSMQIHASCAAREGQGVLLIGPSGLRASPTCCCACSTAASRWWPMTGSSCRTGSRRRRPRWPGCWKFVDWALFRVPHIASAPVALAVQLGGPGERLPLPATHVPSGRPLVRIDAGRRLSGAARCLWRWTARSAVARPWWAPSGMPFT